MSSGYSGIRYTNKFDFHIDLYMHTQRTTIASTRNSEANWTTEQANGWVRER